MYVRLLCVFCMVFFVIFESLILAFVYIYYSLPFDAFCAFTCSQTKHQKYLDKINQLHRVKKKTFF